MKCSHEGCEKDATGGYIKNDEEIQDGEEATVIPMCDEHGDNDESLTLQEVYGEVFDIDDLYHEGDEKEEE